jgi:enoyl-CoA hydratase/carnithine racemase
VTHAGTFENDVMRIAIRVEDSRNALDLATVSAMRRALAEAKDRPGLRLVVLESGLDRVFSLGMNLAALAENEDEGIWANVETIADYTDLLIDLATMPVPTLAIVDGIAAGGGVELACVCDTVIGTENASFTIAQLRKGIFPFITGAVVAPKIGQSRFLHWALSGQTFPAKRLFELGLINQLCASAERDRTVEIFIERVLAFDPQTLRAGVRAMRAEAQVEVCRRIRDAHALFALNCLAKREAGDGEE